MKERILNTLEDKKEMLDNYTDEMKEIVLGDNLKIDRLSELCRSCTIILNEIETLESLLEPQIGN